MLLCVFMYLKMDNIVTHHIDLNLYFGGEKIIFPNAFRHGYYFFLPMFQGSSNCDRCWTLLAIPLDSTHNPIKSTFRIG